MSTKAKILVVDDEEQNLISFKAAFRRIFDIRTAISAEEAVVILREDNEICVVVSDHRMPVKTGVQFLEEIRSEFPKIIRIVLTGYADLDATKDAINKADVYRYLNKPWNEVDLLATLNSAVEHFNTKRELAEKQAELENAYSELSRFVYSASHDLRAPLVSVIGLINLAKIDPNFPKEDMYLPLIEKSIHKLDVFVRNIVDYYQNKERKESIGEVDVILILEDALNTLEYYRSDSGVNYERNINIESPVILDEFRLRVIFNNLISNAVKYQRKDEPNKKIIISLHSNKDNLTIVIKDNGIGIKESSIKSLFEMFYRATNEDSGSGIGLYIVNDAIHKLNGSISVESELGVGTIFTVVLPNKEIQHVDVAN